MSLATLVASCQIDGGEGNHINYVARNITNATMQDVGAAGIIVDMMLTFDRYLMTDEADKEEFAERHLAGYKLRSTLNGYVIEADAFAPNNTNESIAIVIESTGGGLSQGAVWSVKREHYIPFEATIIPVAEARGTYKFDIREFSNGRKENYDDDAERTGNGMLTVTDLSFDDIASRPSFSMFGELFITDKNYSSDKPLTLDITISEPLAYNAPKTLYDEGCLNVVCTDSYFGTCDKVNIVPTDRPVGVWIEYLDGREHLKADYANIISNRR